jgi:endo-1,4-beta-xylanase
MLTAAAVGAVVITTPSHAALRTPAATANRFIGYAANASLLCNNQAACTSGSDATYRNLAGTEFNQVTHENALKWESTENSDDNYTFAQADGVIAFAQANNQQVHGHTLVWHSQTPGYVQGLSATAMRAEMQEHINAVVGRYANNPAVVSWDVVNEAIGDNGQLRTSFWLNTLGESYIADAFRFARAVDGNADLCINDYNIEGQNAKSDRLFTLVQSLLQQNVPITCVGFQSHLVINQIPSTFQSNMQRFANLGLKVRITELDIRIPLPSDAQELQTQANNYTTVVNVCRAVSACSGITLWGIDDGHSWLPNSCCGGGNEGDPLLWTASYQQKPAYAAVNAALGGGTTTPPAIPGTPGTPTASNVTSSSLTLSWSASSGTVTNYQIERATGATSTSFAQVGTSTSTSFNDSGLAANTTYRYRVRATNSAGNSAYSAITNVTTGGTTTQPPGTPGTLSASGTTASSTNLSWGASSGTVTNYQIERATGATSTSFAQVGTSTTTSFTNTGLAANTTYRYRVRATNSAGNSGYSNIVNVTTTGTTTTPPGGCSATYTNINQWPGGFQGEVRVTNTGTSATTSWTVTMTFANGQQLTQIWGGRTTLGSNPYTVINETWNGSLGAGAFTTFGFLGSWNGTNSAPALSCTRTP